uniref:hypothetical protein n=1 Tax=Dematophora necatrix TaxID=2751867 RepID=UPI0030E5EFA5
MSRGEHLTSEGLLKIINIKASMNKGLSEELSKAFPPGPGPSGIFFNKKIDAVPVLRPGPGPLVDTPTIRDPNWLAGFVSAEGCFSIQVGKSASCKTGIRVWSRFQITQHNRDAELMKTLEEYLNCGRHYFKSNSEVGDFIVSKLSDITDKIIPFFEKYPIFPPAARPG